MPPPSGGATPAVSVIVPSPQGGATTVCSFIVDSVPPPSGGASRVTAVPSPTGGVTRGDNLVICPSRGAEKSGEDGCEAIEVDISTRTLFHPVAVPSSKDGATGQRGVNEKQPAGSPEPHFTDLYKKGEGGGNGPGAQQPDCSVSGSQNPDTVNTAQTTVAVKVCMLKSVSMFSIPVQVGDKMVDAVVDTAAEVTIISDRVYAALKQPPKRLRDVQLDTAGRQLSMRGFIASPVKLRIGDSSYSGPIYVAPIEQDMLLGLDILQKGSAVLDMGRGTLFYDGSEITMTMETTGGITPQVAKVTVSERRVIPPNSVAQIQCKLNAKMSDYVVEPCNLQDLIGPKVLRAAGSEPVMCLINATDRYRVLKKGQEVARAYPVDSYLEEEPESILNREAEVQINAVEAPNTDVTEIPDHLKKLFDASRENLSEPEQRRLADVLISFEDVFAKDEFDLGTFSELEHNIDTGNAKPIKQRMRRTPACFVGEEEAHLKKMLEAEVIQESTSEWASSPVLIRKRDGKVRWCIDYRALNDVTVKDVFPLPLVDDCLDTLAGNSWFSKLDANSAYWQVGIKPADRSKTAFHTKYGLYEHVRMGFGLCNAPATYSRVMNLVLRGLNWRTVLAFLDDILVLGKNFEDHMRNLRDALARFRQYGLN